MIENSNINNGGTYAEINRVDNYGRTISREFYSEIKSIQVVILNSKGYKYSKYSIIIDFNINKDPIELFFNSQSNAYNFFRQLWDDWNSYKKVSNSHE